MHYFDYAASCPPFDEALAEFTRVAQNLYGNPSSAHIAGRDAFKTLGEIKRKLGKLCNWQQAQIILTSGGTEANNLVLRGIMEKYPEKRLLLAVDVHASAWWATEFYKNKVDVVPLEKSGQLSLPKLRDLIKKDTILFSAVHVCNETGIIHDIAAYGKICRDHGLLFHCDGVQALGHIPVDLENLLVDFYTFSAHKFGGPRGVGGILMHPDHSDELTPQIMGGGQEQEMRAGTENVAGFAAALKALEISSLMIPEESQRLQHLTEIFLQKLSEQIPDFKLNSSQQGLPGLISISIPGTLGTNLVTEMSLQEFALSAGSACHSSEIVPSRIIMAIGRSEQEALETVRISMGRNTTQDEANHLAKILGQVVKRQRMLA